MLLSDVVIVLSRPEEAGNVGAVCRAMKNMGLSRLRLVPGTNFGGDTAAIRARAVHAADVWEKAETFDSLAAAVKDCALVIGTTRRRGRHRKQVTMTPPEIAAFLKSHPAQAALVFGNERTGLEDGELELCNFASHIPADEAFPSLNLSHAVQIYAYELFKTLSCPCPEESPADAVKGRWVPLDQGAIEVLVGEIMGNLKTLGFYKRLGQKEQERFFRDIFSRSAMTEREGRYFADIIAKAVRLAQKA
jgi:tRNA/rRNA methyltransferase/tRNA (cytidine32/uridine32-2'-O)-methyltransferase